MIWLLFASALTYAQLVEIDIGPANLERTDSVSVLSKSQIEKSYAQSADEVLRNVAGVTVVRSGGPGQTSFLFVRGADSAGTLVLVDGLPMNDPSLSNGAFDFSLLSLDGVESVEIWKGPQSVLYGSGATGGVINIVTQKGKDANRSSLGVELGSYSTWKASVQSAGAVGAFSYALSGHRLESGGISASREGSERDSTWMNGVSGKFAWTFRESEVEALVRYSSRYADLDFAPMDTPPGVYADARNYWMRGDSLALGLGLNQNWSEKFRSALNLRRFAQTRKYLADPESIANPAWLKAKYGGETYRLENPNILKLSAGSVLSFGPSAEFESGASEYFSSSFNSEFTRKQSSIAGGYARWQLDRENYFATAGSRYGRHNRFGDQFAVEVQPGLHLTPNLDLLVRFATAYKAPTLFELFDPQYGNPNLTAERVQGLELTLTQFFDGRESRAQISLFKNEYRDLIHTVGLRMANVGSAYAEGIEIEGRKHFDRIDLQAGYTYLETRDNQTGQSLLRRPRNGLTAQVTAHPFVSFNVSLDYVSADHREELTPVASARTIGASFQVLNGTVEWQARANLKVYARVLNLLDAQYEETAGYGTYRRSGFAGVVYGL